MSKSSGAKADNLARMHKLGLRVPKFTVLKDAIQTPIDLSYPLILRSSTSLEDQESGSFAGVFHSEVVKQASDFAQAYKKVQQANHESIQQQAKNLNLDPDDIHIHYIAQEYVKPGLNGVMKIPAKPSTEVVIESTTATDGVTSGVANPDVDTFDIHASTKDLTNWQTELLAVARKIQNAFTGDQELEWLQAANKVYIVQVRPYVKKDVDADRTLREEYQRLQHLPLHAGHYQTNDLPDISSPTPLTLEVISNIYSHGLYSEGIVKRDTTPLTIIAANLYLDTSALANRWLTRPFTDMVHLFGAYRNYVSKSDIGSFEAETNGSNPFDYFDPRLIKQIFQTTRRIQIIRTLLGKKLGLPAKNQAFVPLALTPLQNSQNIDEFWFLGENEYELSAPRYLEDNRQQLLRELQSTLSTTNIEDARSEALNSLISVFDQTYCHNLFKLYDYLQSQRFILHDQLIESIAYLRKHLLQVDSAHKLQNTIWFASIDEIASDTLPPHNILKKRQDDWFILQSLPLKPVNELTSWEGILTLYTDNYAESVPGTSLTHGTVQGVIGKDIQVVSALTQGLVMGDRKTKGIITERGGALSHVALLAREQNIPVIRIDQATHRFTDGQTILIDTAGNQVRVG